MAKKKNKSSKNKKKNGSNNKRSIPTREPVRNIVNAQSLEDNTDIVSDGQLPPIVETASYVLPINDDKCFVNISAHHPDESVQQHCQNHNEHHLKHHSNHHNHHHHHHHHHHGSYEEDNESNSILYESNVDDWIDERLIEDPQQSLPTDGLPGQRFDNICYNPSTTFTSPVINNGERQIVNDISTRFDSMALDLDARIHRFALDVDDDEQEHEDIEDYEPGGYCPIQMFDLLQNRYSVVMKLGWGHFSTVWLCWDIKESRFVAIKVMKSADNYREAAEDEVKLLKKVRDCNIVDGKSRIVALYDNFTLQSINGTHICMVFEVLGGNLLKLIIKSNYRGIPLENVRTIIKQVLSALHYLHTHCGIIHTDMKPENVLLVIPALWTQKLAFKAFYMYHHQIDLPLTYRANVQPEQLEAEQIRRNQQRKKYLKRKQYLKKKKAAAKAEASGQSCDGCGSQNFTDEQPASKVTTAEPEQAVFDGFAYPSHVASILSEPEVLLEDELLPVDDPTFKVCDFDVKVADLGNACWRDRHFTKDIQTRQYRSPEVIIGAHYDISADIWSVACLAFELATGDYLFDPRVKGTWIRDGEHLALMKKMLGPIPHELVTQGSNQSELFFSNGQLRYERMQEMEHQSLFEVLLDRGWEENIAHTFYDFLMEMLHWDPNKRATALECLQHPFIVDETVEYEHIMSYIRAEDHSENESVDDSYDERSISSAN